MFSCEFCEISKKTFFTETSGRLLLNVSSLGQPHKSISLLQISHQKIDTWHSTRLFIILILRFVNYDKVNQIKTYLKIEKALWLREAVRVRLRKGIIGKFLRNLLSVAENTTKLFRVWQLLQYARVQELLCTFTYILYIQYI